MRKTMAAVLVFGLVWIGYLAWPLYDLLVLLHAIETRDVDTVRRHVSFDAVRISLTDQVVAAYVRRTGIEIGPLRRNIAAAAIADPVVVKRLVSPEALTELLAVGWPITVLPDHYEKHDWDYLADFWKFGIWPWQVRSGGTAHVAAAATLSSYVPIVAVALATGRRHPTGEY